MPPAFYGRRKSDPKPIRFPEHRRIWERGPVVVTVVLVAAIALGLWLGRIPTSDVEFVRSPAVYEASGTIHAIPSGWHGGTIRRNLANWNLEAKK